MKNIQDYFRNEINAGVFAEKSLHIFSLGFEERCLSYPEFLSAHKNTDHKYVCLSASNDGLSPFLVDEKDENKNRLDEFFSTVEYKTFVDLPGTIKSYLSSVKNVFIDISVLPRKYIFKLFKILQEVAEAGIKNRVFIIYTFPTEYVHNKLQQKSPEIEVYSELNLNQDETPLVYMLPGFTVEDTNIVMAFLNGRFYPSTPQYKWLIAFPGADYNFYERALESHLPYLDETFTLFPYLEVNLAFERLKEKVLGENKVRDIIFVPIGSRLTCVPIILCANFLRSKGYTNVHILAPKTKEYDSLRSIGYSQALIEEVYFIK
jgi:hypothetical protein